MAYITKEELLRMLIKDPSWVIHYHRDRVKQLLPELTKAYILTETIEEGLIKELRQKSREIDQNPLSIKGENWLLIERYVRRYPYDWAMVFKRGEELLEISVPEEAWRAFDIEQGD